MHIVYNTRYRMKALGAKCKVRIYLEDLQLHRTVIFCYTFSPEFAGLGLLFAQFNTTVNSEESEEISDAKNINVLQ